MAYRDLSKEEVNKIIEDHQTWLDDVYGDLQKDNGFESYMKKRDFDFDKLPENLANDPRRANFSNVRFTQDNMDFSTFNVVDLSGANFKGASFTKVKDNLFYYAHLNYVDFSNVKLPSLNSKSSWNHQIFGCEFRHANLQGLSDKVIKSLKDSCDLDGASTDKGIVKSILVPYKNTKSLPNDYYRVSFYGVSNYAHLGINNYTNIPFDPMIVTDKNRNDLLESGYKFDEKQHFLKYNEGQEINLSVGRSTTLVKVEDLSKACCEAYLGNKKEIEPKTVTNENKVWFVKLNPTARAPKNAIEFIPVEGHRDHDHLILTQNQLIRELRTMLHNSGTAFNTDMIGRGEHYVLSDRWELGTSNASLGDTYPTYIFNSDKSKKEVLGNVPGDLVARGEVVITPFMVPSRRDNTQFLVGAPYNLFTMNNLVKELTEVQNEKRIQFYKDLTVANGLVPRNCSDEELTQSAKENMILIKEPWQLTVLNATPDEKTKADVAKIASFIDCMNDKETLALQKDAKEMKFLYYNTYDIAKQINYIAKDICQSRNVPEGKPVPEIGDKSVDKVMAVYNEAMYGLKKSIAPEGNEKQKQNNRPLYLICPESSIKMSNDNLGIVLDSPNHVIAWTNRVDGKDATIKQMVSTPKEKALATINEKNEQLKAKGYKPVDVSKMRTVALLRDAKWGLTVNGKHVDLYNGNNNVITTTKDENTVPLKLTTQAIFDASTYGKHFDNGKWVVNDHRKSPVLVDEQNRKVALHSALSKVNLLKDNNKNNVKDLDKEKKNSGNENSGR